MDVDYNKSVSSQIEPGLVGIINRTQGPILRLMQTFGMNKPSEYCNPVNTILGICRIYRSYIKEINSVHLPPSYRSPEKHINKQETIERLANIEMDFNAMSLDSENENKNN